MEIEETKPATNAERQRAYRQRVRERLAGLSPSPPAPVLKKPPPKLTRPKQLEVVERMLRELMDGYELWLERLPANLAESEKVEQLHETIDHLQTALDAVAEIDPPRVGH